MGNKNKDIINSYYKKDGFCGPDCRAMHQMGIPLDNAAWLELGYLMRNLKKIKGMSSSQKREIQEKLIHAFKCKKYQPEEYSKIEEDIDYARHLECHEKSNGLKEIIEGMTDVISDLSRNVGGLMSKQKAGISEMDKTTDMINRNIQSNRPKAETVSLLNKLRGLCRNAMHNVAEIQHALKEQAVFDSLTKLFNRGAFDREMKKVVEKFKENSKPLSLIMLDIDFFKKVNDTYGHQVGDQILIAVSNDIKQNVRDHDFAARYGGEEIAVIFYDMDMESATRKANSIREVIEDHEFTIRKINDNMRVTVSIGVMECKHDWRDLPTDDIVSRLISGADTALYRAKDNGRNMVC